MGAERKNWAPELADRVQAVINILGEDCGWKVDRKRGAQSDQYLIVCPDGQRVPLHRTTSDVNAPKVALRLLNLHGFQAAERRARTAGDLQAQRAIAEDRRVNDEKLAAAQEAAERRMLDRVVTGQGEDPDISVLMAHHPVPRRFDVTITGDMAKQLLTLNTGNRRRSKVEVQAWIRTLAAGEGDYTHEGMATSDEDPPRLLDGQTRLEAIAACGIPMRVQFTVGLPSSTQAKMGTGRRRTPTHVFEATGVNNASKLGPLIRAVYIFDQYNSGLDNFDPRLRSPRISNFQLTSAYEAGLRDAESRGKVDPWSAAILDGEVMRRGTRSAPTPAYAMTFLLGRALGFEHPMVTDWMHRVAVGEMMPAAHPAMRLRSWIRNAHGGVHPVDAAVEWGVMLLAWKDFARGHTPSGPYRLREDSRFPSLFIPDPGVIEERYPGE